ncbi:hypothetical protein H0H92_013200 [Tricholoma furcatifolium]|nr:hypothetical protein H0H92_013200 [Tricholoma furcatifolium]
MSFRVWLVTGTSSGFGQRIVQSALKRGDRVIATARSLQKLQDFVSSIDSDLRDNLRTLQLDITDGDVVLKAKAEEAVAFWGQIDVLVNNAGIGYPSLVEEGGSTLLRKQFATNVFGVMDVTTAFLPHLRASKQSTIVVVGSRSAWKTEIPGIGPYAASKAAVHAFTETLAVEVAQFNIRVLLVAPGSFRTEGIYGQSYHSTNPIAAYDTLRDTSLARFNSIAGTEKGDPCKAMEVVVDIVRGEGVASGRPWPGLIVLGEDAERDVRDKCGKTLKTLDEWKETVASEVSLVDWHLPAPYVPPADGLASEAIYEWKLLNATFSKIGVALSKPYMHATSVQVHLDDMDHPILTLIGLLCCCALILRAFWSPKNLDIPTLGYDGPVMSYFSALRFVRHGDEVLREGCEKYKDRAFKIPLLDRWLVVVNGEKHLETLRNGRDDVLSSWEAMREINHTLGAQILDDPFHINVIRTTLTKNLPHLLPHIREEAAYAFEAHIGSMLDKEGWTPMAVEKPLTEIVCQVGSRAFVGLPLCRNEEYRKLNIQFTTNVMAAAGAINLFPRVLKPFIGALFNKLSRHQTIMLRLLGPEIEDRKRKYKEAGIDYADKPNDMLTWVLESATPGIEQEPNSLALRMLNLSFTSIHSTYVSLAHTVYNLAAHPLYLDILRDEIQQHLNISSESGTSYSWALEDLDKCIKLDSFLKESLRLNGLGAISLPRKALVPLNLPDGTFLPVGTIVTCASTSVHLNEAHYDDPKNFDGLRFAKMREACISSGADEDENSDVKYRLTSAGPAFLTFGGGKHICRYDEEMTLLFGARSASEKIFTYSSNIQDGGDTPFEAAPMSLFLVRPLPRLNFGYTFSTSACRSSLNKIYGTGPSHTSYIFLHAAEPPTSFQSKHSTPLQRELQLKTLKWGGTVNFSWFGAPQTSGQWVTAFSTSGGRLEIPDLNMENLDEVAQMLEKHATAGPLAPETADEIHLYVCTHGARDCRCGNLGGALAKALREEVLKHKGHPVANRIKVGEVGHVGGHKLGMLQPEDAPAIVAKLLQSPIQPYNHEREPIVPLHWRGRMGMAKDEQIQLFETLYPTKSELAS